MTSSSKIRGLAGWLFLTLAPLYVLLTRGHFFSTDEVQVYQQTRSLWDRANLSVPANNNVLPGRDGHTYAPYGIGQSVMALPLYAAGKAVHRVLDAAGSRSWIDTFAGPIIGGNAENRWGGDVEIFFVNLLNCFVIGALAACFFMFSVRMGAQPRSAVIAALLLAVTTHVAGFSSGFFQHGAEALFLLCAFYLLFSDSPRTRILAGAALGAMILVRASSVIVVPVLIAYLLWRARTRRVAEDLTLFLLPVAAAVLITGGVNYIKWGSFSLSGGYGNFITFDTSWMVSLYGYLFSPGQSIFLFSPLLILAPLYFQPFARRYPRETVCILAIAVTYMLFYGKASTWDGQWYFGPRFLVAVVPLLLLPLASWLDQIRKPAAWIAVAGLSLMGLLIEVLHVAVNVSYVYYREGYDHFVPKNGFIFLPASSQIVAHWHALLAWDNCVDLWLVNVARQAGPARVLLLVLPLAAFIVFAARKLAHSLPSPGATPAHTAVKTSRKHIRTVPEAL